jgi:hypothetical protein
MGEPQVTGLFIALSINQFVVNIIVPVKIDGENRYALSRAPDQYAIARTSSARTPFRRMLPSVIEWMGSFGLVIARVCSGVRV